MEEVWIIVLAIIGILITGYITISHAKNKKVVCPINSRSCNAVLDSEWSSILGVKNEVLGLLYYISMLIGLWLSQSLPAIFTVMKGAAIMAALYSLFLIGVQAKSLKEFCFYCLLTALINIVLALMLLI